MFRRLYALMLLGLLSVTAVGCCCVQGMPNGACGGGSCGGGAYGIGAGGMSACGGNCGSGPLLGLAGCRGACGEVYVDEWISEPPIVDNCPGEGCGGCNSCRQPVRNLFSLLWGRPYRTQCDTGLCGPTCGDGCGCGGQVSESYGDGYVDGGAFDSGYTSSGQSSCNCGSSHGGSHQDFQAEEIHSAPQGVPQGGSMLPGHSLLPGNQVPSIAPEVVPTPAPPVADSVAPSSATRRLNPALSRRR